MIHKAVIPAAGFGTRMLPAAKAVPKELLPILDRPTIQYVVEEAASAGIGDVLLITSREKRRWKTISTATLSWSSGLQARASSRCWRRSMSLLGASSSTPFASPCSAGWAMRSTRPASTSATSRSCACSATRSSAAICCPHGNWSIRIANSARPSLVWRKCRRKRSAATASSAAGRFGRESCASTRWLRSLRPTRRRAGWRSQPDTSSRRRSSTAWKRRSPASAAKCSSRMRCADWREQPVHGIVLKARRHDIGNPLDWLKTNLIYARRDPAIWGQLLSLVRSLLE